MHDTLDYMARRPGATARYHHDEMTFGLIYAFSENFVLPLSHDEVVHGKGSLLGKMPGDDWQQFANLRAYYGFMWAPPGQEAAVHGQRVRAGARVEPRPEPRLAPAADAARTPACSGLVRDLNTVWTAREPALHALDCRGPGFDWI